MQTNQIREAFIDFFKQKGHEHIESSPLVPIGDPSLMFTNSGMVQFKKAFTGQEKPRAKRAVTCQKSMRAGGKHNDLENVGYTTRHHTFFEMLGNFSFGDYFKEEAIVYAWELLKKVYLINPAKLLFTVHKSDSESALLWQKVTGAGEDKVIVIDSDDNFWSMGDSGPCGPCSEIFYDYGDSLPGGPPGSPQQDGPRYVEIWNLVFMQYEQIEPGKRVPLAQRSIDTGMGLERIASVLQGKQDNYEIDIFQSIIQKAESIAGLPYESKRRCSYRIVSDHIRAITFLISEGVLPGNVGRNYVLRKIMRRAIKHARELSKDESILSELVPIVAHLMGDTYPELIQAQQTVKDVAFQEEERFVHTLNRGCIMLEKLCKGIASGGICPGQIAFELYDTYGFPLELTQDVLKERNIEVDLEGFHLCMQHQQELAKSSAAVDELALGKFQSTEFARDSNVVDQASVVGIVKGGKSLQSASSIGEKYTIFLDKTPFYAESGGQVGDTGTISALNLLLKVTDTKKALGKLHAHEATLEAGEIELGQRVKAEIDQLNRAKIACNHSATHILHQALKETFSQSVEQRGSLVGSEQLRFDFNYLPNISPEKLNEVEKKVNQIIINNLPIHINLKVYLEAVQGGAIALFGERYEDMVRVVSIGEGENQFSSELCGGTHVSHTGEIGLFKVTSISSIASGIKRISAVTGLMALEHIQRLEGVLQSIGTKLKAPTNQLLQNIESISSRVKLLEAENRSLKVDAIRCSEKEAALEGYKTKYGQLLYKDLKNVEPEVVREALLSASKHSPNSILVFSSTIGEKVMIIASVGKAVEERLGANSLIDKVSCQLGSKGGGNKSVAHAGVSKANFDRDKLLESLLSELNS